MISIIGAGPSGSYLASLLAPYKEVSIFEEHLDIGKPIQCTGILSSASKALKIKISNKVIVNKIKRVELIAPNNKSVMFKLKEPDLILDRTKFDRYLNKIAIKKGAMLYKGYRFLDFSKRKIKFKYKGKVKEINTDILVGADGPNSHVAKISGLYRNRGFWVARQCRVKYKQEKDLFKVYFGVCPDFFGWIVPEGNEIARIGIASKKNSQLYFNKFLKKLNVKNVINYQSGLIPIYNPSLRRSKNNIYLLGDAAMQAKALSGGGIIKGMLAAEALSEAILENKDYEKLWRNKIGKDLYLSLKIRQFLNRFSKKDYNKLISVLNPDMLKEFNREFPSKSLLKIALNYPKLDFFVLSKLIKYLV